LPQNQKLCVLPELLLQPFSHGALSACFVLQQLAHMYQFSPIEKATLKELKVMTAISK
jgi:hypothetical protein